MKLTIERRAFAWFVAVLLVVAAGCEAPVKGGPQPLLEILSEMNRWAATIGALGSAHGREARVRRFVQMLVADHGLMQARVVALSDPSVDSPAGPTPKRARLPRLSQLVPSSSSGDRVRGRAFDSLFMQAVIEGHQDILSGLSSLARAETQRVSPTMRDLMEDALRIEHQHLDVAIQVFAELGVGGR